MAREYHRLREGFYRIARMSVPTGERPVDGDIFTRRFSSVQEAITSYLPVLQPYRREDTSVKVDNLENLSDRYGEFLMRFGYDPSKTKVNAFCGFLLLRTNFPDGTEVAELVRYDDNKPEQLKDAPRVAVESIMVSAKGETNVLVEPYVLRNGSDPFRGTFVSYSPLEFWFPHVQSIADRWMRMDCLPLGSGAGVETPYAAAEFFHEMRHLQQDTARDYQELYAHEIDASEYALRTVSSLQEKGINLMPYMTLEQATTRLEKYLRGYAYRHYPVRSRAARVFRKI